MQEAVSTGSKGMDIPYAIIFTPIQAISLTQKAITSTKTGDRTSGPISTMIFPKINLLILSSIIIRTILKIKALQSTQISTGLTRYIN